MPKADEFVEAMKKMENAIKSVFDDDITSLSDAALNGCHEMIWAAQQDFQSEWVRRKMLAEGRSDA